jgi:hypothetical protein
MVLALIVSLIVLIGTLVVLGLAFLINRLNQN